MILHNIKLYSTTMSFNIVKSSLSCFLVHFLASIHLLNTSFFKQYRYHTINLYIYGQLLDHLTVAITFYILYVLLIKWWRVQLHINVSINPPSSHGWGFVTYIRRHLTPDWLPNPHLRCHWLKWEQGLNLPGVSHPSTAVATESVK